MYYGKPDIGLVDMNSSINEFKKQNRDKNFSNIKEVSEELIAFLEEYTYPDDVKSIVKYYFELFKTDLKRDFQYMDEELFWDYINECDKSETYPFIEYLSFSDILSFDVQDIMKQTMNY